MHQCNACGAFGFHKCKPEMIETWQRARFRIASVGYKLRRFVYRLACVTAERRNFYRSLCTLDAIPFCPWLS